jgi:hypothetical protein
MIIAVKLTFILYSKNNFIKNMKKLSLLLSMGVAVCLSACQKDSTNQPAIGNKLTNKFSNGPRTDAYNFAVLTPISGSPGTYSVTFNGTQFYAGEVVWDDVDYSASEDGVPTMGTLTPVTPLVRITQASVQKGGSYFAYQTTSANIATQLNTNIANFEAAFDAWAVGSDAPDVDDAPQFTSYVKNSYVSVTGITVANYGCKLIRRNLGGTMYYALAETDYPIPPMINVAVEPE